MRKRRLTDRQLLEEVLRFQVLTFRAMHHLSRRQHRIERTIHMASKTTQEGIDNVASKLQGLESATDGIITLLGTISGEIRDNKDDPAELDALADRIDAKTQAIAEAVTANTPSEGDGDGGEGGEGGETA